MTRKGKFDEMFDRLRFEIPTFGIISTAYDWQFSRSIGVSGNYQSTSVELSEIIRFPFEKPSPLRTETLIIIMGTIVNILDQQIATICHIEEVLRNLRVDLNTIIPFEVDVAREINEQTREIGEEEVEEDEEDEDEGN